MSTAELASAGEARAAKGAATFRHVLFGLILLAFWISTKPFGALAPGEVGPRAATSSTRSPS